MTSDFISEPVYIPAAQFGQESMPIKDTIKPGTKPDTFIRARVDPTQQVVTVLIKTLDVKRDQAIERLRMLY